MTVIKYLRKKHNLSLRGLANKINSNFSVLSSIEREKSGISRKKIKNIASILEEDKNTLLIAQGYLPDYTKEARTINPVKLNKDLQKSVKSILTKKEGINKELKKTQ